MPLFRRDDRREPSVISRADRAREAGQWEAAAGLYRIALDRKPRNPPIWIQYGHALKEGGDCAAAETAYRNAIAYQPDDPEAYLQLGHVLKLQGKMVEARLAYRCALVLDASLADAARELGQLQDDNPAAGQDGAIAEAREFNQASLAAATASPAVRRSLKRGKGSLISRADRAREALQWDIAADLYRRALDRNPDNPPIWVQFGHALKESGNLAEAERAYRAAIARDPTAADFASTARSRSKAARQARGSGGSLSPRFRPRSRIAAYLRGVARPRMVRNPRWRIATLIDGRRVRRRAAASTSRCCAWTTPRASRSLGA